MVFPEVMFLPQGAVPDSSALYAAGLEYRTHFRQEIRITLI